MVLTPICPHTLTNRPLVFRPDARLEIRNASGGPVTLTIDGQWGHELASGASIEVRRADAAAARSTGRRAASSASCGEKLSWGERQELGAAATTVQRPMRRRDDEHRPC